ncbi:hypothetical protein D1AOALGA4SA_12026 [Olavius algarvensis Delta 1 endosymbiont]|nr:hypothetical protein D1AOALGA4SA_12026 [Olavius algarvensis Delta 1 endosymbiont]
MKSFYGKRIYFLKKFLSKSQVRQKAPIRIICADKKIAARLLAEN